MRPRPALLIAVVLALSAAACGGDGDDTAADPGTDATDAGTEDTAEDTAEDGTEDGTEDAADDGTDDAAEDGTEAAGDADLAVADTDFGEVLVDGEGMTLYLFTNDSEGESVCVDDCAATWPPLTVDGEPVAGEGVDESLLSTIERSDGGTQVTYAGAPLYTYAPDSEPGDVTGQGVGDVWFVVGPDGEAITEAPDAAGSSNDLGY